MGSKRSIGKPQHKLKQKSHISKNNDNKKNTAKQQPRDQRQNSKGKGMQPQRQKQHAAPSGDKKNLKKESPPVEEYDDMAYDSNNDDDDDVSEVDNELLQLQQDLENASDVDDDSEDDADAVDYIDDDSDDNVEIDEGEWNVDDEMMEDCDADDEDDFAAADARLMQLGAEHGEDSDDDEDNDGEDGAGNGGSEPEPEPIMPINSSARKAMRRANDPNSVMMKAYTAEEKNAMVERGNVVPESKYLTSKEIKLMNLNINSIKNTALKAELLEKQRTIKDKLKRKRRADIQKMGLTRIEPKTQEDMREPEPTLIKESNEEEVLEDQEADEYAAYFKDYDKVPKVLITTGLDATYAKKNPSKSMLEFILDLARIIPNSYYVRRRRFRIKEMIEYAKARDFTDLIVIGDYQNKPYSMILCHLPEGPTASFRISNAMSRTDIVKNPGHLKTSKLAEITEHPPELVLNNFTTRIGYRIARILSALFPKVPDFTGRRVATFHNQRDFIFFRHHRYEFDEKGNRCALQEIGPRFTLRLQKLQLGTFDTEGGEYEWFFTQKMEVSRRKFFM